MNTDPEEETEGTKLAAEIRAKTNGLFHRDALDHQAEIDRLKGDLATSRALVELGRQWIEHAPEAKEGPVGLAGFSGPVGFVCQPCASRILGRGCNLRELATLPVWEPEKIEACALCASSPGTRDQSPEPNANTLFEQEGRNLA